MIRFARTGQRPVVPTVPGTWKAVHTANAEVLPLGEEVLLYFRGQGEAKHDQIGVATAALSGFDGVTFREHPDNPRIAAGPADYDRSHVLDPGAVVFEGRVYLYYTAHGVDGAGRPASGTGVAVSDDGYSFRKPLTRAVVEWGMAPDAVVRDGKVWLTYARSSGKGQFGFYANASADPLAFDPAREVRILSPCPDHAWEARSIITPRLFEQGPYCYMTYVGSPRHQDYGFAMGLARSPDLVHWERYPHNPVFQRADGQAWDNCALWFGTLFRRGETYYLYYEGGGGPDTTDRDQNYAGYGKTSCSQIGLATYTGPWWS